MTINKLIEQQARYLASETRNGEPDVKKVYWFPDDEEVRLVSIYEEIPISLDGLLHPLHFRPSPEDDLPSPSAVAMIRSHEFGTLKLPRDWGNWEDAIEV